MGCGDKKEKDSSDFSEKSFQVPPQGLEKVAHNQLQIKYIQSSSHE
jgi:hypothetical protein